MKPIIAIVGRPNVGKSTLFNRMVAGRGAIVEDTPGVTRDRQYGETDILGRDIIVVDTGGFEPTSADKMLVARREQAEIAIEEADAVLCVFDGLTGPLPQDEEIARMLSRSKKPVFWVVNKVDGPRQDPMVGVFYELGIGPLWPVSAQHAGGVLDLMEAVFEALPKPDPAAEVEDPNTIRVAIIGRPNVGKSTLLNRLLGEERMIVSEVPGTTRDSIDSVIMVKREDGTEQRYLFIDTAGVRRRKWVKTSVERISIVRTFKAIDRAQVCLMVLDATEGVSDQDARLAGLIAEKGRACVILLNKWDALGAKDNATFGEHVKTVQEKLDFIKWAPILTLSGLTGQRATKIFELVDQAHRNFTRRVSTSELNKVFEQILHVHQPPVVKNRRLKLYYATQVASGPPTIILWCNDPVGLHFSYRRFLSNRFREHWSFEGTPLRIIVRARTRRSAVPDGMGARVAEARQKLGQEVEEIDWDRLEELDAQRLASDEWAVEPAELEVELEGEVEEEGESESEAESESESEDEPTPS